MVIYHFSKKTDHLKLIQVIDIQNDEVSSFFLTCIVPKDASILSGPYSHPAPVPGFLFEQ